LLIEKERNGAVFEFPPLIILSEECREAGPEEPRSIFKD
jgi:hypothetical protein